LLICALFWRNNICKKTQFSKWHLLEWILQRWILTRHKLKWLLLAALTAQFFWIDAFIFERSGEIDQKKKSTDLVLNQCHEKTNSNLVRSAPYLLVLMKQQLEISVIIWIIKLVSVQTTSGKCHASVTASFCETKGFFCFLFNKRSPKDALGKLKMKRKSTKAHCEFVIYL